MAGAVTQSALTALVRTREEGRVSADMEEGFSEGSVSLRKGANVAASIKFREAILDKIPEKFSTLSISLQRRFMFHNFRLNNRPFSPIFLAILSAIALFSCRKDRLLQSGGEIFFSTDTLTFDTVFTQAGSFTTGLKIYNRQPQPVVLSSVRVAGGEGSQFKINVDGQAGNLVRDVRIEANDSIYVFAIVNINPTAADAPFIVEDRLIATLNGEEFSTLFQAYGQNANYIRDSVLSTQTWTPTKPYVIINSALVDEGETLTIQPGVRVYVHADSRLLVQGTLRAEGRKTDSIIFQGDRLDRAYFGNEGYPGEWGGLYFFSRSTNNLLRHVILRNGGNSALGALPALIQVNPDSVADNVPQLTLDRCVIENSIGYGLLSLGGTVRGDNVLIHSCGAQALAVVRGGRDTFNHCTFALYSTASSGGGTKLQHIDNPAVALLNYLDLSETTFESASLGVVLRNCIIWGSLEDEVLCAKKGPDSYEAVFDHCILKTKDADATALATRIATKLNEDPEFEDPSKQDFHLKNNSAAKDAATFLAFVAKDLEDRMRSAPTDIGCYERP